MFFREKIKGKNAMKLYENMFYFISGHSRGWASSSNEKTVYISLTM